MTEDGKLDSVIPGIQ